MESRWTAGNVLLAILAVLVLYTILLSGWSFVEIIEALVVIVVVVMAFYWLAQRNARRNAARQQ